jgi:ABC-type uncharacterized transport system ATPase subunit
MSAMLEMRGICKRYDEVRANRNIDLEVPRGQILDLLGEDHTNENGLRHHESGRWYD